MSKTLGYGEITVTNMTEPFTVILTNEAQQFATDSNRKVVSAQSYYTDIIVMRGSQERTDYTIGNVTSANGITVSKSAKRVTFSVAVGTVISADAGTITIPITLDGQTVNKTFSWSLGKQGPQGVKGNDGSNFSWNMAKGTSNEWSTARSNFNGSANVCPQIGTVYMEGLSIGDTITVHLYYKYTDIVPAEGKSVTVWIQGGGNITGYNPGFLSSFSNAKLTNLSGSGEFEFLYSYVIKNEDLFKNDYFRVNIRHDYIQSGSVQFKGFKVEKGTVATPWSPHPDDLIGEQGKSVSGVKEYYLATSASSGVTYSTSGWSTDPTTQKLTPTNKYLWNCKITEYDDGTKSQPTTPVICGTYGDTGKNALQSNRTYTGTYTTVGATTSVETSAFNRTPIVGDVYTCLDGSSNTGTWQVTAISGTTVTIKLLGYVKSKGDKGDKGDAGKNGQDGDSFAWNMLSETNCGKKHWDIQSSGGKYTVESITTEDNIEAVKLTCTEAIDSSKQWMYVQFIDLEMLKQLKPSTKYTLSYDIKTNRSGKISHSIVLGNLSNKLTDTTIATITGDETWQHVKTTITTTTMTQTPSNEVIYLGRDALYKVGYSIIKNLKLVEGDVDTPWAPSQSDLEGRGVSETIQYYLATSASSGVTYSTSGWSTDISTQKITTSKKYLWNCYQTKYTDGTSDSVSTPTIIGVYGETGDDGISVKSVTEHYAISPSSSTPPSLEGKNIFWADENVLLGNASPGLLVKEVGTNSVSIYCITPSPYLFYSIDITNLLTVGKTYDLSYKVSGKNYNIGVDEFSDADFKTRTKTNVKSFSPKSDKYYRLKIYSNTEGTASTETYTNKYSDIQLIEKGTSCWSSKSIPVMTDREKYLWNYKTITYSNGVQENSTPVLVSTKDTTKFHWNLLKGSSMTDGNRLLCDMATANNVDAMGYTNDGYHLITKDTDQVNNGIMFKFNDYKSLGLKELDTITFSCDIKGTTLSTIPRIAIRTQGIETGSNVWWTNNCFNTEAIISLSEDFKRYSVTATIPRSQTYPILYLCVHVGQKADVYIRNLKLEKSDSASSWSLSEEELAGNDFSWNLMKNSDLVNAHISSAGTQKFTKEIVEDSETPSGYACKVTTTTAGSGGIYLVSTNYLGQIKKGDIVTVSALVKCSSVKNFGVMNVEFISQYVTYITPNLSTTWQKCIITGVANKDIGRDMSAITFFANNMAVGDILYISSPKIEKGYAATDWCTTYEETLAKSISITPSAQIFKSTDGGNTFAPNQITLTPTLQGAITFGKWQYSIDGGVSFTDVVSGQKGLTVSNNVLTVAKTSALYSDTVTMVTFRAVASDSSFYDVCSIAKLYDVTDIGDGRNLLLNTSQYTKDDPLSQTDNRKDGYKVYSSIATSIELEKGKTYTLQAKTDGNWVSVHDISGSDISEKKVGLWLVSFNTNTLLDMSKGYAVFTPTVTANYKLRVNLYSDGTNSYTVNLWDIKLEKGTSPTGWSAAPEDVQTAILSNKSSISSVSSTVDKQAKAIEEKVGKTTYQTDLNLIKGDLSKANDGLGMWKYEIYPKSLFDSGDQGKCTLDVFANNKNLTPSQVVLLDDTKLSITMNYGDQHIAYAVTFVKMSDKKSLETKFSHDDGGRIYLNGKLVGGSDTYNTNEAITLSFAKGWNCLEVVVNEKDAGEGFKFGTTISTLSECEIMNCYYATVTGRESKITNQLVQNTTDISGITNTVSDVMTAVGDSGKIEEFKSNYSKWKQSVDNIESNVSKTYVTNDTFNNLQIGGRNLLLNSNFFDNTTHWVFDGITGKIENDSIYGHCFQFSSSKIGAVGSRVYYDVNIFKHVKDVTYSLSFYAKADSVTTIQTNNGSTVNAKNYNVTTSWQRFTNTYVSTGDGSLTFWANEANKNIYLANIKIEESGRPTDWTAAPEDSGIDGQNLISNLPVNWEQGSFTSGADVGSAWSNMKTVFAQRLRTKDLVPVADNITISAVTTKNSSNETLSCLVARFDSDKKYLGHNTWSSSFPRVLNLGEAKYIAIILKWGDGNKTVMNPSDISNICLKIERGTSVTPFTLAPTDVNGKIVNVESVATQTADQIGWLINKNGSTASSLKLTQNALTAIAENIDLTGKVKFSSFNSDTQNKINSIDTKAGNAQESADSANTAAKNAQSSIDNLVIGGRNYIYKGRGNEKAGFFKNFNSVNADEGYGEVTLTSKKIYVGIDTSAGYLLNCRDYNVGKKVTFSFDIMYTVWDVPEGAKIQEYGIIQRYTRAPAGETATGTWTNVTGGSMPQVGRNGCELNKWYHHKITTTIPTPASDNVATDNRITLYNNSDTSVTVTFRMKNVQIEYGTKDTDYTPSQDELIEESQKIVDNMVIGGRNLLLDSKALSNTYYTNNYDKSEETFKDYPVRKLSGAWQGIKPRFQQNITERNVVKPGDTLTYSVYGKTDNSTEIKMMMFNRRVDSNKGNYDLGNSQPMLGSEWKLYSISFTVTKDMLSSDKGITYFGYEITSAPETGKYVYFACPKLEIGSKATDYAPAPEDTDDAIDSSKQAAIDTASKDAKNKADTALKDAKSYSDQQIDDLEVGGVNLFVKSTITKGYWLSAYDAVNSNTGWGYSDYIDVSGMKNYIASGFTNLGVSPATCFYDANKTFISGTASKNQYSQDSLRRTLAIPSNAKYMRFSFNLADIDTLKIEQGTKATAYSPSPEDVSQDATDKANQALSDAKDYASSAVDWVKNSGTKTNNLYTMVSQWTNGAVADKTYIYGGWLKTNTITADKIAIGDFTNYCQLDESTANYYGFSTEKDTDGIWYTATNLHRDIQLSKWYPCEPDQKLAIEYDISTTVQGLVSKDATSPTYMYCGIMIFGADGNGKTISYMRPKGVTATEDGAITHVSCTAEMPTGVRSFAVFMQINGYSPFTGTLKIRNISVRKAVTGKLIVDGSITANKIAANTITADKISVSSLFAQNIVGTGTISSSKYAINSSGVVTTGSRWDLSTGAFSSPNLKWDASGNITAKGGYIGKYKITDQWLITGSGSTCTGIGGNQAFWAGGDSSNSAPFRVSYDGKLVASGATLTDADVSGNITAKCGQIGNLILKDGVLTGLGADIITEDDQTQTWNYSTNISKSGLGIDSTLRVSDDDEIYGYHVRVAPNEISFLSNDEQVGLSPNGLFAFHLTDDQEPQTEENAVKIGSLGSYICYADTDTDNYIGMNISAGKIHIQTAKGSSYNVISIDSTGLYTNNRISWGVDGTDDKKGCFISCANYNDTNNIYFNSNGYYSFVCNHDGKSGTAVLWVSDSGVSVAGERGLYSNTMNNYIARYYVAGSTKSTAIGNNSYATRIYGSSVWANKAVSTSDERLKQDFEALDKFEDLYMQLQPVSFKYLDGYDKSEDRYFGLKAQSTEHLFETMGENPDDYAMFNKFGIDHEDIKARLGHDVDFDEEHGLDYTNLISLNTHMIQKTRKENAELKERLKALEDKIAKLNL